MFDVPTSSRGDAAGSRRFWAVLGVILVAAVGLRVGYVLTVTRHDHHLYDATFYELEARAVADGRGFVDVFAKDRDRPAADHPPLTVLVLVPGALIPGASGELAMRLTIAALGVGVVALVALLARRVAGDAVGLLAGGIAAVYPNLWMSDGLLMSETIGSLLTTAILVLAYRVMRGTTNRLLLGLGLLCGLAMLARAELALLAPFIALPAILLGTRGDTVTRRLKRLAVTGATAVVVVGPWVGFNLARFEEPVTLSTNDGIALAMGSCDSVFYEPYVGYANLFCLGERPRGDQSEQSRVYRERALDYINDHLRRYPVVVLARVGRLWSVFKPGQTGELNVGEGRPEWASWLGVASLFVLAPFAAWGVVVSRRRKTAVWPLVVPLALVTAAAAFLTAGLPRYRAPAEPGIVVLAAIGAVALRGRSGLGGSRTSAQDAVADRPPGHEQHRLDGDPQ